jgi:hypothetical protein
VLLTKPTGKEWTVLNKKMFVICIMGVPTVGGILINLPMVSFGIHVALLIFLIFLLIKSYNGQHNVRVYVFPCVLCQIATVGPYYSIVTVHGPGFSWLVSIVLGGVVSIGFAHSKKILPTASKLLLVGIFVISSIWFAGQTMLVNAMLQSSDTEIYIGEIKDKEVLYGRMLNDYWIFFDYYDAQDKKEVHESVPVSKNTYRKYKVGDGIRVEIYHGLLGIEYYDLARELDKSSLN